ncbi:MAG: sugar phosphate isomerase/epimerase [Deinococcales bacterium]
MQIGLMTDSLGKLSFDDLLPTAAGLGISKLEFACGNWSTAPHLSLDELLDSEGARATFLAKLNDHALSISALNCSGNQLAPGELGKRHHSVVQKTFQLAELLGVDRIVMMSGLPAGPGDQHPNWITTAWPAEVTQILRYQWQEVAIPYWQDLVKVAKNHGIRRICIEQHAHQLVYNTESLLELRNAVGEMVGVNFDPSHMMWMGGEPLRAIRPLADAIYHVHAKDTRIDPENSEVNTLLETKGNDRVKDRSWNYVTLGYGHNETWWRNFVTLLRQVGYDDVLSIEHEDLSMPPLLGVEKSVDFLNGII